MGTIDTVDRPVLLDANIILNASFIPNGQCDRALKILSAHQKSSRVEDCTWQECEKRLAQLLGDGAAGRLAIARLKKRMAGIPNIQVPPVPVVPDLPRHDQHIMEYARRHDVIVLTTDNGLRARLLQEDLRALAPDDQEFWDNPFYGPPPAWLTSGDSSGVAELVVLLWAIPGAWVQSPTKTTHTLFSAKGWGRLVYMNECKQRMRFEAALGGRLETPLSAPPGAAVAAAVSTRLDIANFAKSESAIYACAVPGPHTSAVSSAIVVPLLPASGERWLGSTEGKSDFWNGHLRSINIAGAWLSKRMWGIVSSHKDFRPSFCIDNGKLQAAVVAWWSSVQSSRMTG